MLRLRVLVGREQVVGLIDRRYETPELVPAPGDLRRRAGEWLAAFMLSPLRWQTWDRGHLDIGRTVARAADDRILGWSALAPVPDN